MVKLLHLCRITYDLQNQDTPNRFGVTSICLQVAIFQNDLSVCNRPEKRMTLRSSTCQESLYHKGLSVDIESMPVQ